MKNDIKIGDWVYHSASGKSGIVVEIKDEEINILDFSFRFGNKENFKMIDNAVYTEEQVNNIMEIILNHKKEE